MKSYLVTGGAGFIGSHLVEKLLAQGERVIALDDFSTGREENLAGVLMLDNFLLVQGTVTDEKLVAKLVAEVDGVYHLAASVGVQRIVSRLVESMNNNIEGTRVVLEAAAKIGKKVLITSTSEVYGRDAVQPFTEGDDLRMGPPHKTRWSYACSKALDEYLSLAYYYEHKLPVVIARLFNTVGERQSEEYGMVLPRFVGQALTNRPLTIYGDGRQSRCFCHVSDVVEALIALWEKPETNGQVYNVGAEEEITIEGLADLVIELLDSKSKKEYIPYEEAYIVGFDDIARRVPNINKLKRLMDFNPKVDLGEIIRRMAKMLAVPAV
jgi:UDP-glucose 4-epimerase